MEILIPISLFAMIAALVWFVRIDWEAIAARRRADR